MSEPAAEPRLPREVDACLLQAGYQFAVDADLDALTPEALIGSFRNWRALARPDQLPGDPRGPQF
jgi:hypothetical protein